MATTFKFGNKNWAIKEDYVLAYNDENDNFKPLPFDFTRATTATYVDSDGLIKTAQKGYARIDYTGNTDGHLLLEPSRTNLVTYSEDFTQWTKQSITDSEISLVSNSLTGSVDASELEDTSTSNYARLTLNTTTSASTAYRFSCFVKKTTGVQTSCPAFQLEVGHDYLVLNTTTGETKTDALDAGNTNYSDINVIDFNSEWWKLEMTATSAGTSTRVAIYPAFTGTFGSSASSSNIGTVTIYGIQVEQGSYATSYIPTEGSSVTRNGDDIDLTFPDADSYTSSNGFSIVAKFDIGAAGAGTSSPFIYFWDDSSNTYIGFGSTSLYFRCRLNLNGTAYLNSQTNAPRTQRNSLFVSCDSSGWSQGANGVTNNTGSNDASLFNKLSNIQYMTTEIYGIIKITELLIYNTRLTDSELETLTT